MAEVKLDLGSGNDKRPGFTSVDLYDDEADIKADICEMPFGDNSVDEAVAFQVIEHVPYQKSDLMFKEIARVLKPGASLTLETPDVDYIAGAILTEGLQDKWIHSLVGEYYRPWDKDRYDDWENCAAAIHRNPWNLQRLKEIAGKYFKAIRREEQNKVIDVPENLRAVLVK